MINLQELVPLPEGAGYIDQSGECFPSIQGDVYSAAQMSALREQVAREVAMRCAEICQEQQQELESPERAAYCASAIAAEFGLEKQ